MTEEMLASVAIRMAIISRDEDINALGEASHVPADRIAHYLADRVELDAPELEALTAALWGSDVVLVHGRVRPVTAP